jgi:hypothetical protein
MNIKCKILNAKCKLGGVGKESNAASGTENRFRRALVFFSTPSATAIETPSLVTNQPF